MSFTIKKVNTQTLGEGLVNCRNRLGLSLADVAKAAQVQPKYLLALEEGRFSDLPATVYIKGFLKSLAKLYHLEEGRLLAQFLTEYEIAGNTQLLTLKSEGNRFVTPRFILSPKTLTILTAALLGLLSLAYLYFQVNSLSRKPRLEIFSPAKDGNVSSGLLLVRGQTEPGATIFLNNQTLVVDAEGKFRENLSLAPGTNQLVIKAVNKFGQETILKRSIVFSEKEIAGSQATPHELRLEVVIEGSATWIYLEADGVEKYSGTMLPQARKTITAQDKVILTTGNAGSTRVVLNGSDLGILGQEGEVIRDIEFTR